MAGGKVLFIFNKNMSLEVVGNWLLKTNQYCATKYIGGVLSNWMPLEKQEIGQKIHHL